jgi:hypothetical protein
MLNRARSKLTYANVVSTLCLFLVLGGTGAYAATQLAKNSVGSTQLKKGAVTLVKIAPSAQATLKGKAATGARGPAGPQGESGPVGPQPALPPSPPGATGPTGPTGPVGTGSGAAAGFFGSGSDGDETLTGTGNVLVDDTYYDDLTLAPGAILDTNGYRLFVAGTLTLESGSSINRDGRPDELNCGGNGLASHTLGGAGAGGCMNTDGEGTSNSLGGNGGDGGDEPGIAKPPLLDVGGSTVFDSATQALTGRTLDGELVSGGAGGGSPSPSAPTGGGGGGVVVIAANAVEVVGSAAISARGGDGLGGGGGGVVIVISSSPQPAGLILSAAGGVDIGSGTGPGEPGTTRWLN